MQEKSGGGATTTAASGEFDSFEYPHQDDDDLTAGDPHSRDT